MKSLLLQGFFSLLLLALFYAQFPRNPILEHAQSQRVWQILIRIKITNTITVLYISMLAFI